MKETLTCLSCSKSWNRKITRGRKPNLCPSCISLTAISPLRKLNVEKTIISKKVFTRKSKNAISEVLLSASSEGSSSDEDKKTYNLTPGVVYSYYHPSPPNSEELREQTKNGSTWRCTSCKFEFSICLPINAIPTHKCAENGRSHPCVRVDI